MRAGFSGEVSSEDGQVLCRGDASLPDYGPFYKAAVEFSNGIISRSRFVLDWEMAQNGGSVADR